MTDDQVAFAAKFKTRELHLAQLGNWDLAVRPGQLTLGAMVISARSGETDFAALDPSENVDLVAAFALAEKLSKTAFGAVRINLLCLMMQDPIVHFHVLPRYDTEKDMFGETWFDRDWPGPPKIGPSETSDTLLRHIRAALRSAL